MADLSTLLSTVLGGALVFMGIWWQRRAEERSEAKVAYRKHLERAYMLLIDAGSGWIGRKQVEILGKGDSPDRVGDPVPEVLFVLYSYVPVLEQEAQDLEASYNDFSRAADAILFESFEGIDDERRELLAQQFVAARDHFRDSVESLQPSLREQILAS